MRVDKKGAMELSIGTIVIIVLAMSMLILGMVLIKNIFSGAQGAITGINKGVINEINNVFADSEDRIAVAPATRKITIKQGARDEGFAFSVRNTISEDKRFTYIIEVDPEFQIQSKCSGLTKREVNEEWLLFSTGSMTLAQGKKMQNPELVLLEISDDAPLCTIPLLVSIKDVGAPYTETKVFLTIEGS